MWVLVFLVTSQEEKHAEKSSVLLWKCTCQELLSYLQMFHWRKRSSLVDVFYGSKQCSNIKGHAMQIENHIPPPYRIQSSHWQFNSPMPTRSLVKKQLFLFSTKFIRISRWIKQVEHRQWPKKLETRTSLTSNKLYWIKDQLTDVSTQLYTPACWCWQVEPSATWL